MINKIEEKLILLRAKKFTDNLEGLESFSISLLGNDIFLWHRDELKMANAIDNKNERVLFKQPVAEDKLINAVISLLNIDKIFLCWLVYEDRCGIFIRGNDFKLFLASVFRLNNSYDASLIFESPDRVISISDNEYDVDIFYKLK
ncbi:MULTISPECIES: hypothetical protein [unclassified Escherichia]|uniref:hypothetical protein n=1 Tax=unclassified Escherichia TaxID=2608889 RepID=UPI00103800EE|nr:MULTISPECIES: hypothetical protein [unclassified Escherichia]TBR63340.1 hypothetical protein D9737_23005 [Escherichia sp. E10V4]TLI62913.1 hypothetical protein FEK50_24075 [Escherichia sp. E2586]